MGLAIRAAGCGYDVRIFQFCKGRETGELNALKKLEHVTVQRDGCQSKKFVWQMDETEKAEWAEAQQALFDEACEAACDPEVDMVVMDEVLGAVHAGAVDLGQVRYLVGHKCKGTELVMTGRGAPEGLVELADYVTEMRCVKHPYERGVDARRGIEM